MAAEYDTATSVWDIVSHVISSQYRCAILRHLSESPGTPTGIANGAGYDLSHVSRALGKLPHPTPSALTRLGSLRVGL